MLQLAACSSPPQAPVTEAQLQLIDFAAHQRFNVTTDLISVPEGIGLGHFEYGWQRQDGDRGTPSAYAIRESVGRLMVFSADGDLAEVVMEIELVGRVGPRGLPVDVKINHRRIGRVRVKPGWAKYRLRVPPRLVHVGSNLLALHPRLRRQQLGRKPPSVQIRHLQLRSGSGRRLWPQRPAGIEWTEGTVEMPSASYLDMVFRVAPAARLLGAFEFEPAPDNGLHPVYIYAQLLDEKQTELSLFHRRVMRRRPRAQPIAVDLEAWTGQLVRLRVGITGPGNGLLRWRGLRIDGDGTGDPITSLPPISQQLPTRSARLGQPDVLVILLDAARADGFSPFGGPHPTPHTERLAGSGTVFQQALSPAPWTGQSVPAILTGLFPDTLGVGPWGSRLPEEVPTLAELMAAAGYRTVLWSQHPFYRNYSGFARGFQEVYRSVRGDYESLPQSTDLLADDQPTFAFVHLIPPHAPYQPPAPFRGAYSSWYTGGMSVDAGILNSFPSRSDPRSLTADDLRYTRDRYLENVAFADDLVGRLLAHYDRADRYEESLIVLLSDHGEAFLEHGRFLHGRYLYREFVHVPLVFKWPSSAVGSTPTVADPVSLVDLVPTLVDGLDLAGGEPGFQGRTLLPVVFDQLEAKRALFAMTRGGANRHRTPKPQILLEADGWRLFYSPLHDRSKLFRAEQDPTEKRNLATELPLQALLLRQSLLSQVEWNRKLLAGSSVDRELDELDPETVEQLEALGYLN